MDALILEASTRVLAEEGLERFTTNRVAERAGISIGSLYQYYPNKAAVLFRLHELEVETTRRRIVEVLRDESKPQRERVFEAIRLFFETEAAEIPLRNGLADARVPFQTSKVMSTTQSEMISELRTFLRAVQPGPATSSEFDARFAITFVASLAEALTNRGIQGAELRSFADRASSMLCDHIGL